MEKLNFKAFGITIAICLAIAGGIWWLILPAVTLQSSVFWALVLLLGGASVCLAIGLGCHCSYEENYTALSIAIWITLGLLVAYAIVALIGSAMFNAGNYQEQATIVASENEAITELPSVNEFSDIPTVDKATAEKLGDRTMGNMEHLISLYEVDSFEYSLIKYGEEYYRIAPLKYGGLFKYSKQKEIGIPGYVLVDVYTGEAQLVELDSENTIFYAPSAYFGKDLYRHLRGEFPSTMFWNSHFEIDDNGHPYYITEVREPRSGVFNAYTVSGVIITDCTTGECTKYAIEEIPAWVDNVYSVASIMKEINWSYQYINGFWNLSSTGVRKTSYSFDVAQHYAIPKDGKVYVYTGVTSAGADESNIGFLLIDMRTGVATYFDSPGAEESSAQESAKGLVQQYGYTAGPVMLVNINGEETYFFALKDAQLLVKMYALVNKTDYTVVVVENTIEKTVDAYREKIGSPKNEPIETPEATLTKKGTVASVYKVTMDGNTMYIFYLEESTELYLSQISNSYEQPAKLIVGAKVIITYNKVDKTNVVSDISFE